MSSENFWSRCWRGDWCSGFLFSKIQKVMLSIPGPGLSHISPAASSRVSPGRPTGSLDTTSGRRSADRTNRPAEAPAAAERIRFYSQLHFFHVPFSISIIFQMIIGIFSWFDFVTEFQILHRLEHGGNLGQGITKFKENSSSLRSILKNLVSKNLL